MNHYPVKRSFSSSLEVQAIRRKRHKQNSVYSQVKSNYIFFDYDYDEWDPIPDWSGNITSPNDKVDSDNEQDICDSDCHQISLADKEEYKQNEQPRCTWIRIYSMRQLLYGKFEKIFCLSGK